MTIKFIKCQELYNLLNQVQSGGYSQLSDSKYLFLVDARAMDDYEQNHIPTAIRPKARKNEDTGEIELILPYDIQLESKSRIVVYDGNSRDLSNDPSRPAVRVAIAISRNGAQVPVEVLFGGFEEFSSYYPFLRTTKIGYTQRELDAFKTYPNELIRNEVYLGTHAQFLTKEVVKDLKLTAFVHFHENEDQKKSFLDKFNEKQREFSKLYDCEQLHITADVSLNDMKQASIFIDQHRLKGHRVLITCPTGRSNSATCAVYYTLHESDHSISKDKALRVVFDCKNDIKTKGTLLKQF